MRSVYLTERLICILLLVFLLPVGAIGVSYCYFSEVTVIKNSVSTGNIDVVFSDLYIINHEFSTCIAQAEIINGGKGIEITIDDALPGDTVTFGYEVLNNGTVPVVYTLKDSVREGSIEFQEDMEYICADGGTGLGTISVSIADDAQPSESYGLYLELYFQQAIVVR